MSTLLRGVYIVGAKRTPFGSLGGKLSNTSSIELATASINGVFKSANLQPELVDSVTFGNVSSATSPNGIYLARHAALNAKIPIHVPCLTVNRLCGSGFQSVVTAAQEICLKDAEICIAGGTENMSQTPYFVRGVRFGVKLGVEPKMEDGIMTSLTDLNIKTPMAITAENLSKKYNISREDCDKFALRSQQLHAKAQQAGHFKEEMEPIQVKVKRDMVTFDIDEHAKPLSSLEGLAKLNPVFLKDGTVTAGNASGISDGAGAIAVASKDAVDKHGLKPLAEILAYSYVGCEPSIMGIGPVLAIRKILDKTGLKLDDVDIIDINEAFAAQFLACQKELGFDLEKANVNGGAIALGHPVGASGARITANLVHELRRRKAKLAIGSACIGGGQGIAILLRNTAV